MRLGTYRFLCEKRKKESKFFSDFTKKINALKTHRHTQALSKTDNLYIEPIQFLKHAFPKEYPLVAELSVYTTTGGALRAHLNEDGVGGLFSTPTHDIFLNLDEPEYSDIVIIKIPHDMILYHEMLHAVSCFRSGSTLSSKDSEIEEDFAYGGMIPYVRSKGYNDREIAEKVLLGYCLTKHLRKKDYFKDVGCDKKKASYENVCSAWSQLKRTRKDELKAGALQEAMIFMDAFGHVRAERGNSRVSALEI